LEARACAAAETQQSSAPLTPSATRNRAPSSVGGSEGGGGASLAPLSERIRRFHELLSERSHRGPHGSSDETQVSEAASVVSAATGELGRAIDDRVAQPLDNFQRSLELLAEEQRRLQQQQELSVQQLREQGARQEQLHCEQVLQLEEALLSQSLRREAELADELLELEDEWQDLEVAGDRLRSESDLRQDFALTEPYLDREQVAHSAPPSDRVPPSVPDELDCAASSVHESGGDVCGRPSDANGGACGGIRQCGFTEPPRGWPSVGLERPEVELHRNAVDSSLSACATWRPNPEPSPAVSDVLQRLPEVYKAAVALVLEYGWEVLHGGDRGEGPMWTALHWAAAEGRTDVCRLLLQCPGAAKFVQQRDEMGRTPLDYAVESGQQAAVDLLIDTLGCQVPLSASRSLVGEQRV